MATIKLSLGLVDHCDRSAPIVDGSIKAQGVDFVITTDAPGSLFRRIAQLAEFDISEMSFSTYLAMRSRGDDRYIGLPIFPRRTFRHGFIFVNTKSGISAPRDLVGQRVGVPEYQQTAALWIRGILRDEYGVATNSIHWFEGGLDIQDRPERLPLKLPANLRIERIRKDQTLSDMLRDGVLDAVIGTSRPPCFVEGVPHVRRLFPDYRAVEQDYYRRTGFFPIMHMMVLRRLQYEAHPWLARNICKAFEDAKRESNRRFAVIANRWSALPWLLDDIEELERVFGKSDYWPYGIEKNRRILTKMLDMSNEEGLSPVKLDVEELFAESERVSAGQFV
jgi:4,5-dihydroxyphthalate decarboxylase